MASYHYTVKAGASFSAAAHADYIEREGKYKTKDRDDLEAVESGNLPEWSERSGDFWQASDEHERANAKGYREYEVALPREMTPAQRIELVREFVHQELGDRHAYTFAIHNPRAALEGGEQPHAHIMFSERHRDGIERNASQYFKRYNAKNPEKGGSRKGEGAKTPTQRKADLVALRERWATLQNAHLEKHGYADRVDHRSLDAQGIERLPTEHMGPTAAAMEQRGKTTRCGQARAQRLADIAELGAIPGLFKSLQSDQAELGRIEAQPTPAPEDNPIQKRNAQEAKAAELVAMWSQLIKTERAEYLKDLTIKTVEEGNAHHQLFQAHMDAKPMLLGRKEWERKREQMSDRHHLLQLKHSELAEGRYPFLEKDKEAVEQAVLQRATAKQPQLAAAQAPAEKLLKTKAHREQAERMEKARAEYQVKQAKKAEKGLSKGYSR